MLPFASIPRSWLPLGRLGGRRFPAEDGGDQAESLAAYLTRLVLLAMLPLVLLGVLAAVFNTRRLLDERRREAEGLARAQVAELDQYLAERIRALQLLAASPSMERPEDRPRLYREAQRFQETFGSHVILAGLDRQMLFNTRSPLGADLPALPIPKGRASFPIAIRTGKPAVSDSFMGPVAKEPLVSVTLPVLRDGEAVFGLLITLETSRFQERLNQFRVPQGWAVTLVDQSGATLARQAPPGFESGKDVDRSGRFSAHSEVSGWTVVVEIPRRIWRQPVLVAVLGLGIALLSAILLGLLVGALSSRRIAAVVGALGDEGAAPGQLSDIREISSVRARLEEAARHREASEGLLRDSEARFRQLFQEDPVAMGLVAADGRILAHNTKFEEIFGYTAEDLPTLAEWWRLAYPEPAYRAKVQALWAVAAAKAAEQGGGLPAREYRVTCKDGRERTVQISGLPIGEDLLTIFQDLTALRETESALREHQLKLETVLESMTDAVFISDAAGRFVHFNEAFATFHKFHGKAECAKTFAEYPTLLDVFLPNGEAAPVAGWAVPRALRGETAANAESRLRRKDTGESWVGSYSFAPIRDQGGAIVGSVVVARDITERIHYEEALREGNQRMKLATDSAHLAVWDWDLQTGTMVWDDRMFDLYGTTRLEINGTVQDWKDGLHPDDLEGALLECEAAIQGEAPFDTEFRVRHRDGTIRWIKANAQVLRDQDGHPVRMVGVNRDVTDVHRAAEEKAKLQAQLQQSQKMESLGTLAGGVAHDMNNVLGAILGLASAHIGTQPPGSPLHQALDTICKATERGGKMVKGLLSFARQSPEESHELDLNAVLREQVALLERTTLAKVRLQMDLDAELRPILGDASALTHAFMNLCVNAVDAMPENGTLTLRTRNVDRDWVEVVVADNGKGMSREVLEKALDPFYTTKGTGKGTGLGLSMVFSTIKAHQGQLTLESEPDRGTRVILRFPACEPRALADAEAMPEATLARKGSLKVLFVDDDELIRSALQMILETLGHTEVTTAQSGEEALARLEAGLAPDLVILDMNMPGLGGAGTLPRLRALRPELPVLLCTGRTDQAALSLASAHAGVILLAKPFGLRELQEHIARLGLG